MLTCTKRYDGLPFAHRQWRHDGHCALIHGHNWAFTFTFAADRLTDEGFVVDFGKLRWLKRWIEDRFDHTLVINLDDPRRDWIACALAGLDTSDLALLGNDLVIVDAGGLARLVLVEDCSCEGLAVYLFEHVAGELRDHYPERGVRLVSVTVDEDHKNSAAYQG